MTDLDRRARLASLWMVGSGLSFTAMAALIKISSHAGVPFPQVVFYRGLIAFLLAWAVLRFRGEALIGDHWRAQAVRGMIGIVVGELYGSAIGLGLMINKAGSTFQTDVVFVGVFTLVIAGLAFRLNRGAKTAQDSGPTTPYFVIGLLTIANILIAAGV